MQKKLFFSLFLTIGYLGVAQINVAFFENGILKKKINMRDSLSFINFIRGEQLKGIRKGCFFLGLDSLVRTSSRGDSVSLYFHKGSCLKKTIYIDGKKQQNFSAFIANRLKKLVDNGYPFAQIRLDSIKYRGDGLSARLMVEKGPLIYFDSLLLNHSMKTSRKYIEKLLGILPGRPFDESSFQSISKKLEEVSFLSLAGDPVVFFKDKKAYIRLNISENPVSTFGGVIGVQPEKKGSSIVGMLDFDTRNLFHSGNKLKFHWEKYSTTSQELSLGYQHAFIFETDISPVFDFHILKQDSIFLSQSLGLGLAFKLSPEIQMLLSYQSENGSVLVRDRKVILSEQLLDYHKSIYFFTLSSWHFKQRNIRKNAFNWRLNSGIGSRTIIKNRELPLKYYDSLAIESVFLKVDLVCEFNWRIRENIYLNQRFLNGWVSNTNLARNELYRLGGLRTLRGFNEKAFFTDFYFLTTGEIRFFFEKRSFLYFFYDQAMIRQDVLGYPLGTGMGFSLESSSGEFNFAIAMGKSKNQSFDFSGLKVHFGYVSTF